MSDRLFVSFFTWGELFPRISFVRSFVSNVIFSDFCHWNNNYFYSCLKFEKTRKLFSGSEILFWRDPFLFFYFSFCFLADFKKEFICGFSWHLFYTLQELKLGCSLNIILNFTYNNLEVVSCGTVLFPAEHVIECTCHRIIFSLSWGKKHSGNLIEHLIWNITQYPRCLVYFFLMRTWCTEEITRHMMKFF